VPTSPTPANDQRPRADVSCPITNTLRLCLGYRASWAGAALGLRCLPHPSSLPRPPRAQRAGRQRELIANTAGGA
jgi:hypothetical protein